MGYIQDRHNLEEMNETIAKTNRAKNSQISTPNKLSNQIT